MADKSIAELGVSQAMTDDAKLAVYQGGETRSIEGQLIKQYARESTKQYVEGAKQSAQEAAGSAESARADREGAETSAEQASQSSAQAAGSASTAQNAANAAETARSAAAQSAAAAQTAATGAQASKNAASASEINAGKSASDAAKSKTDALAAKQAAESAKASAETSATLAGSQAVLAREHAAAAGVSADAAEQARQAIKNLGVEGVTLQPGSTVAVEKLVAADGTVRLKFSIPQGAKGDKGDTGATGAKGDKGDKGDTGATGAQGPKGATGDQGVSITSIEHTSGTGTAGSTDTYTVTLSNGEKSTFQVYNGRDGEGAGDMTASVYDPTGKAKDVFAYADSKSAYQQAVAGGYKGTEAEFQAILSNGPWLPVTGGTLTGELYVDALRNLANISGKAGSQQYIDFMELGDIGFSPGVDNYVFLLGSTGAQLQCKLDMSGQKVTRLAAPTVSTDATPKAYVDAETAKCLPKSGGAMSGDLNMGAHDIRGISLLEGAEGEAVALNAYQRLSMSVYGSDAIVAEMENVPGDIKATFHAQKVTGIPTPTDPADAANKAYVDEKILVFGSTGVYGSAWSADATYSSAGYNWRAAISCPGVTGDHRPDVTFAPSDDSLKGNLAPFAISDADWIYIYAKTKPTSFMTAVMSIVCIKGV